MADGRWMDGAHDEHDPNGRLGGGQECLACPVCVLLQAISSTRPEVLGHLLAAGRELTAALQAFLNDASEDAPSPTERPGPRLQRIDLDGP